LEDAEIVRLYWNRDEQAVPATAEKYGPYCTAIASRLLRNSQDAEECVNDTYLNAWNSMPPHSPNVLSVFLGKITRNLAINRYRSNRAEKRGGGEIPLILDELAECVSGRSGAEEALDRKELIAAINAFVSALAVRKRRLFIRRYWHGDAVSDLARELGMTPAAAAKELERTRKKLRTYLKERGFEI
jgi:RNA polymerase sigma factor (sigma-70 family)